MFFSSRSQRPLGQGRFDYATEAVFAGRLQVAPVPGLWLAATGGQAATTFTGAFSPLVGTGKHGPPGTLLTKGDRNLSLHGHLISRHGKKLIEVTSEAQPLAAAGSPAPPAAVGLGRQILRGEIVDSKCYFGVMKPGQGKAHRDCAVRCISGGAPPAFVVRAAGKGGEERTLILLLVGVDGGSIASRILEFVAEPVEIAGEVSRLGDQLVLSTDPATIHRITE